jgi:uncharacterized cupredoxin-like copper-binding protein
MRLELENASTVLSHRIGVRAGGTTFGTSPVAPPGGTTFVDVSLAPGTYQVFCSVNGHDGAGMVIPFTVT